MTFLLALCQFGAAVFTAAVPWCPNFWSMLLMRVLMGISCGGLDSGKSMNEPLYKTCLRGFRSGPTQTRLYRHRGWLEASNFE